MLNINNHKYMMLVIFLNKTIQLKKRESERKETRRNHTIFLYVLKDK